jgi:hypothetical protein
MKPKLFVMGVVIILALSLTVSSATGQQEGTAAALAPYSFAFTYQGQLQDAGGPINGTCDLRFGLWDAASGGLQVGDLLETSGAQLVDGLFTARLDFGAGAHSGGARWLEVAVRCPAGSGSYETLNPRQELTAAPAALSLALPFRALGDNSGPLIFAENYNNSGTLSTGVFGSGFVGLTGASSAVGGIGVRGNANPDNGVAYGVYGESASPNGFGVYGQATSETGATMGVSGYSSSTSGTGVYGWAGASSGETYGVYGKSSSDQGVGVYGSGTVGVEGSSDVTFGIGVFGDASDDWGRGVLGLGRYGVVGSSSIDFGEGVHGTAEANGGAGVFGEATITSTVGVGGTGVKGQSLSPLGTGVSGDALATTGSTKGVSGYSWSTAGKGVYGNASAQSGNTTGVYGESRSTSGRGVIGDATSVSGTTYGVVGYSASPDGYAGYFRNTSSGRGLYVQTDTGTGNIIEAWSSFSDMEFWVARDGNVYADEKFNSDQGDYAELLPASAGLQPGDVLVIGADGSLTRSSAPAQTTVAGVYSTRPGFLAGAGQDDALSPDRVPLAVMGVVPVKVTAENGPIQPGDLLTTSSTPGHAMLAGTNPLPGTVIGKALGSWEAGSGLIQMLVMLR